MNMALRPQLPGWTPAPKKSFLCPDLQEQIFISSWNCFICGAGAPGKHWIHCILHRMTGRMFFWTDIGKWVKKKLNLNVYFLWVPISNKTCRSLFSSPFSPVDHRGMHKGIPPDLLLLLGTQIRLQVLNWASRECGAQSHSPGENILA